MQSLIKCSKRQYAVPRRLLSCCFQNDIKKYTVFNTIPCINIDSTTDRLRIPVSYHTYKEIRKEFNALQSVLLKHGITTPQYLRQFCSTRNYSTPSDNRKNDPSKNSEDKDDEKKKKDEEVDQVIHKILLLLTLLLSLAIMTHKGKDTNEEMGSVSWNEFAYHMLAKGEVAQVIVKPVLQKVLIILHDGAVVKGKRTNYRVRYMDFPDIDNFEEKVRKLEESLGIKFGEGVQITYERSDENVLRILSFLAMCTLVFISFRLIRKIRVESMNILSPLTKPKYTLVDPKSGKGVRFEDIAGLREAKIEVMEFVDYFKNPQRYKALGAKVPKGVLLLGPPGCGKTLLAKAVATEANVAFFSMNGSEFIEMIGGLGALRVRHLFKAGKKRAPSIIYIDEIDAIGKKRSSSGMSVGVSENDQTLNQLLVEMDGIMTNEDTIVLASTNRADVLDKALLRPGRFNRHILIDLPTVEERKQIFEVYLKNLSLEGKPSEYSEYLSYLTPGFSGADIANVCNEAALHAARDKKKKVDSSDLMYAIDRTVGGVVKKTSSMTPHEKKCVAYHEAGHALVGWLLKHTDALLKITIAPRTNSNLGFSQYIESGNRLQTKEEIFDKMCMIMGGRVAEHVIFNKISTGAQDDLKKITKLAYGQVQQYGMSPTVGLLAFDEEYTSMKTRKPYSKSLAKLMDAEVRKIIGEVYRTTEKVLRENKDKLHLIAEELLKKETLTYDDVQKLIGPPPYEKKRQLQPTNFDKSTMDTESKTPEPVPT